MLCRKYGYKKDAAINAIRICKVLIKTERKCRKYNKILQNVIFYCKYKMLQTRINTGILDGDAKTFKKKPKNLKNNVDNLSHW